MNTIVELRQKDLVNIYGGVDSVDMKNSIDNQQKNNQNLYRIGYVGYMVICAAAAFVLYKQNKHHDNHVRCQRRFKRVSKKMRLGGGPYE